MAANWPTIAPAWDIQCLPLQLPRRGSLICSEASRAGQLSQKGTMPSNPPPVPAAPAPNPTAGAAGAAQRPRPAPAADEGDLQAVQNLKAAHAAIKSELSK